MTAERCDLLCLDASRAEMVRSTLPDVHHSQTLVRTASALADVVRLRTATALSFGIELCVCDLAWVVGAAPNLVSHHLRILRRAGLVTSRREGKLVMCRLTEEGKALLHALGLAAASEGGAEPSNTMTALVRG